jgi:hypothetical protein
LGLSEPEPGQRAPGRAVGEPQGLRRRGPQSEMGQSPRRAAADDRARATDQEQDARVVLLRQQGQAAAPYAARHQGGGERQRRAVRRGLGLFRLSGLLGLGGSLFLGLLGRFGLPAARRRHFLVGHGWRRGGGRSRRRRGGRGSGRRRCHDWRDGQRRRGLGRARGDETSGNLLACGCRRHHGSGRPRTRSRRSCLGGLLLLGRRHRDLLGRRTGRNLARPAQQAAGFRSRIALLRVLGDGLEVGHPLLTEVAQGAHRPHPDLVFLARARRRGQGARRSRDLAGGQVRRRLRAGRGRRRWEQIHQIGGDALRIASRRSPALQPHDQDRGALVRVQAHAELAVGEAPCRLEPEASHAQLEELRPIIHRPHPGRLGGGREGWAAEHGLDLRRSLPEGRHTLPVGAILQTRNLEDPRDPALGDPVGRAAGGDPGGFAQAALAGHGIGRRAELATGQGRLRERAEHGQGRADVHAEDVGGCGLARGRHSVSPKHDEPDNE